MENPLTVHPVRVTSPFLPYPRIGANPLSTIAEQLPESTISLIDRLSIRERNTAIDLARATSMSDMTKSHCLTIATAVQVRPDKNHFRLTTTDTEGPTGFFLGRREERFRSVTTQLDMW